MSYLFRWVRHNQSLAARCTTLITNGNIYESCTASCMKPLYQVAPKQPIMTHSPALLAPPPNPGKIPKVENKPEANKNEPEYVIKFKPGIDIKKVFKQFYSLYGPLFVVCHIGIGLVSLGFFCTLTWFAIDPTSIMPEFLIERLGETAASMTGTGGKFVMAYALHKLLLPARLGAAVYVTRFLSRLIKKEKT